MDTGAAVVDNFSCQSLGDGNQIEWLMQGTDESVFERLSRRKHSARKTPFQRATDSNNSWKEPTGTGLRTIRCGLKQTRTGPWMTLS